MVAGPTGRGPRSADRMAVGAAFGWGMPNSRGFAASCLENQGVAGRRKSCRCSASRVERSNTEHRLLVVAVVFISGPAAVQVVRGELVVQHPERVRQPAA